MYLHCISACPRFFSLLFCCRDIRVHHRPDIFEHSVLVLSKCDKIRAGLEGDIVDKIDLSSHQLVEFPYR